MPNYKIHGNVEKFIWESLKNCWIKRKLTMKMIHINLLAGLHLFKHLSYNTKINKIAYKYLNENFLFNANHDFALIIIKHCIK